MWYRNPSIIHVSATAHVGEGPSSYALYGHPVVSTAYIWHCSYQSWAGILASQRSTPLSFSTMQKWMHFGQAWSKIVCGSHHGPCTVGSKWSANKLSSVASLPTCSFQEGAVETLADVKIHKYSKFFSRRKYKDAVEWLG